MLNEMYNHTKQVSFNLHFFLVFKCKYPNQHWECGFATQYNILGELHFKSNQDTIQTRYYLNISSVEKVNLFIVVFTEVFIHFK